MFPRMIEVIVGIIAAGVVADPPVVGVNVRSFGVASLVGVHGRLGRIDVVLRPGRSWPVSGNMAVADIARRRSASVFSLGWSRNGTNQEHCKNA
jgi:hypothetical protein